MLKQGRQIPETADEAIIEFEIFHIQQQEFPQAEILDPQNTKGIDVHDHTVQESLVKSYAALKQKINDNLVNKELVSDIKKAIFEYAKTDVETSEKAYSTLRTMIKYNGRLESLDADELTVLSQVWARIHDPVNDSVRQDLKDNLVRQLADASMTLDLSRCLSGRIARIIQSLEAIDNENIVNIASTEDIRRELSDKVPSLISKFDGDEDKNELESIRAYVDAKLRKDYVDTKLLTEAEYIRISKDYLDAIEM
jgi:hypothetical protein